MEVVLRVAGRIEVEYERDGVDMDAASGDVRGNQRGYSTGRECLQRAASLVLGSAASVWRKES